MKLCLRIPFFKSVLPLIVLLLALSLKGYSQPLSKSEFKHYFIQGNLMLMEGFNDSALKTFMVLYKDNPANANVNYKIGRCYLNIPGERFKAITYLQNALRQTSSSYRSDDPQEENSPEDVYYYLGQAYHYNLDFDKAIEHFTKFKEMIGAWNLNYAADIEEWKATSSNAKELVAHPVRAFLSNLGDSVNSKFPDYSPVISADESMLAFTSRRPGTGGEAYKTVMNEYLEDIWVCYKGKYGTWSEAKGISRDINSVNNEATIGLSADGQLMYVYRDDNGDGNIYTAKLDGGYWTPPAKIDNGPVNTKKWEPSACLSADGNTLYFVSDRKGGFGGRDIYMSKMKNDGTWGEPINLGETINTDKDEDAPFMHPDGTTFFFSSKGHKAMGGFDVFYSNRISDNVWSKPVNMGYPINTTEDDIYLVTSSDGRRCYYSSFRDEGKGEKDIYLITLDKPIVKSVCILVGYLKNRDGSPIPADSKLISRSSDGQEVITKINEASGKFLQSMFPNKEYEVSIEVNGTKVFKNKFFLPVDSTYRSLGRPYFRRTIYLGDSTVIFSAASPADSAVKEKSDDMQGKILLSKVPGDAASGLTIQLLNDQGDLISSVKTDSNGYFRFNNIPADNKFLLKIDENDPMLQKHQQFYLADTAGNLIMPSTQEGRFFLFKRLPTDLTSLPKINVQDAAQLTRMSGKLIEGKKPGKPVPDVRMDLYDKNKALISTIHTAQDGSFKFENIKPDQNYSVSLKENDPAKLKGKDLYLKNDIGNLIRKVQPQNDFFIFENLPPDLNTLSKLDEIDDAPFLAMQGSIQSGPPENKGLGNVNLTLKSSTGELLETTRTAGNGSFRFERLEADKKYILEVDAEDPQIKTQRNIFLANADGKAVRTTDAVTSNRFEDLPADLRKLLPLKMTGSSELSDETVPRANPLSDGDEKFDFVVYFTYNKKDLDISVGSYLSLMEKAEKLIKERGKATIIIASSSSKVPTTKFKDNKELSQLRAKEVQDKIRASISLKNVDDSKVNYEIDARVLGPDYKNDAMQNRKEYERWQFVKVIVE